MTPLACGSPFGQKCQLRAEAGELRRWAAVAGVQAGLAVPDQRLRQRAQRPQAAPDPEQQLRDLLGEDQRAGTGARVAQARDDDPRPPGLALADRDLGLGLPEIELADLSRPIDRAPISPGLLAFWG
jgi:hypothetical protein